MALATSLDMQTVCGADQLSAGAKTGIEAVVHAMKDVFVAEETKGLLLVNASNAFSVLSRPTALWNCCVLWPQCSRFLLNSDVDIFSQVRIPDSSHTCSGELRSILVVRLAHSA